MSDKPDPLTTALTAALAGQTHPESKQKDWLHGGQDVQREFNKNLSFAVGISGDLIREAFIVCVYLAISKLIFVPLLWWPNARPIAGLLALVALAFAIEIYWHRAPLRWALTYRLSLVAIALASTTGILGRL